MAHHCSTIDFRSDTVTQPTEAMRQAMLKAPLGDDVLEGDPTVRELEDRVAEIFGKPAALFVPSGTMANQLAIRCQTQPGDALIAHAESHVIFYESGAPAAISGVMCSQAMGDHGVFAPAEVDRLFRIPEQHNAPTTLLVVENTHNRGGGRVWPHGAFTAVTKHARSKAMRVHLDGARIWNAVVASGVREAVWAANVDTLSCCFSKGLGAPVGSALVGPSDLIARARRFRKMLGGSMRQAGMLAAAAIHAIEHHRSRLGEDHRRARTLAVGLAAIPGLRPRTTTPDTNMVYADILNPSEAADTGAIEPTPAERLCRALADEHVLALAEGPATIRLVCHLHHSDADIAEAVRRIAQVADGAQARSAADHGRHA